MIRLTGLDAQDPLAFLAALGCLAALSEQSWGEEQEAPTLAFDLGESAVLTPLLGGVADEDELLDALVADLEYLAGRRGSPREPFLAFSYSDAKGQDVRDLKPPPPHFREVALAWLTNAGGNDRKSLDWASAVLTDVAVDNSGNAKPFALHFTAGQQRFLTIAIELLDGVAGKKSATGVHREDLRAAVVGPWPNDRPLKVFSWSPSQDRPYALRALDPSGDQKLGTPGADWLALRGLVLLSSAPMGRRIATGGVHGEWKTGTFSYPVWPRALDTDAVRSLLRHPAVRAEAGMGDRTLPRGVEVLTCRISRSDQGGYGAFSRPDRRQ